MAKREELVHDGIVTGLSVTIITNDEIINCEIDNILSDAFLIKVGGGTYVHTYA